MLFQAEIVEQWRLILYKFYKYQLWTRTVAVQGFSFQLIDAICEIQIKKIGQKTLTLLQMFILHRNMIIEQQRYFKF